VQRADEHVALVSAIDLAEHREVGVAVWAAPLHDVPLDLDLRLGLGGRIELADRLRLGTAHPLDRE
jgi:hypothetical protein